jgi:hypothetical protein
MQVFQVGDGSFPPLRVAKCIPGEPARAPHPFRGRQEELAAIATALEASRLVTLTGERRRRKTRVADQAAANLVTDFPEGWYRNTAYEESLLDKDTPKTTPLKCSPESA